MANQTVTYRAEVPVSVDRLFKWHEAPGALARLIPPWENVSLESTDGNISPGSQTVLKLKIGPISLRWIAKHTEYHENSHFQDIQVSGPFAYWKHDHRFISVDPHNSILEDHIEYRLPGGSVGGLLGKTSIVSKLNSMFRYRHDTMIQDLKTYKQNTEKNTMKIAITGATGLVGKQLWSLLQNDDHQLSRMVRSNPQEGEILWNYNKEEIDSTALEGTDAVIHLAGDGIADGRWNEKKKQSIYDSRVNGTKFLCQKLAAMENPPKTLVCASAIGIYGERGSQELTEEEPAGDSFLANVAKEWEAATKPAVDAGIRVVNIRIGVVLSPQGGALAQMLTPFKMCVGGKIGSGQQYWSWIGIDDLVSAIHFVLMKEEVQGPVNFVSPNSATNLEFTKTLGKVLGRPTIFPMPGFAARLALGEMADELLLASIRVVPKKLKDHGFEFRHPELESCLRHLLGK